MLRELERPGGLVSSTLEAEREWYGVVPTVEVLLTSEWMESEVEAKESVRRMRGVSMFDS